MVRKYWKLATFIVVILLGVFVMSTARAANSSHCNGLDNGSGINKTSLSAYDMCWLDTHRTDVSAGVIKDIAWLRLNDKYYDVALRTLRGLSQSAFQDAIVERFNAQVTEDFNADLLNGIERMEQAVDTTEKLIETGMDPEAVEDIIEGMYDEFDLTLAFNDGYLVGFSIGFTSGHALGVQSEYSRLVPFLEDAQATVNELNNQIEDLNGLIGDYNDANNNIDALADMLAGRGHDIAYGARIDQYYSSVQSAVEAELTKLEAQSNEFLSFVNLALEEYGYQVDDVYSLEDVINEIENDLIEEAELTIAHARETALDAFESSLPTTNNGYAIDLLEQTLELHESLGDHTVNYSVLSYEGVVFGVFDPGNNEYVLEAIRSTELGDIEDYVRNVIEEVAEEQYRNGYRDGYNDGYDEGYRDGFIDGVNSVT